MGIANLIHVTTFGWFIIILIVFLIIITICVVLAVKQAIINRYVKRLKPNQKYYFRQIDSKTIESYIQSNDLYVKGKDKGGKYFIMPVCPSCSSDDTTL